MEVVGLMASCIALTAVLEKAIKFCRLAKYVPIKARKQEDKMRAHVRDMGQLLKQFQKYGDTAITLTAEEQVTKAEKTFAKFLKATKGLSWDVIQRGSVRGRIKRWLKRLTKRIEYAILSDYLDNYLRKVVCYKTELDRVWEMQMRLDTEKESDEPTKESLGETREKLQQPVEGKKDGWWFPETKFTTGIVCGAVAGCLVGGPCVIAGALIGGVVGSLQ